MAIIQDQSVRDQALDPRQSFIVQAPAGSGKTELLTQRYLVLLAHAEKAPEEIVAITFTRKAAAEMRTRVLNALDFARKPAPDQSDYRYTTWSLADKVNQKAAAHHWHLDKNPSRLRILTIDALATFLCRQTPMLTHFGMQPQICEQATPLYHLASSQLITYISETPTWQPILTQLLLHLDNQVNKLESLLANLLAHRDQWLPHIMQSYLQEQDDLRESLETSLQRVVLEKMALAREKIPQTVKQTLILLAQHAGRFFEEADPNNPIANCVNWNPNHTPHLDDFNSWLGLANLLLTKTGEWRKTVTVRMGFNSKDPQKSAMAALLSTLHSDENFKAALVDIMTCPPITYTNQQWNTLTTLTQLLPLLVAQLTLVFQDKGQIDFVALSLAALKALGTDEAPTDLALYLDYQMRHLLIDEFQDTSVVHMAMIEKVTAGWEPNDGRTLFLVGDPMQSIYRFRNAEVGLFLRTQQQGIGHIDLVPLTLSMNFRSQQGMVDWFNNAFKTIFPTTVDIATGRVPYTNAIAALPLKQAACVQTHFFCDQADDAQAKKTIEIIQAYQAKDASKSIAILSRSRSILRPIIRALHHANVPFKAIDIEPLAHRPEIQDLLSLTTALLHRADRIAWLSVLRSPCCGCRLDDLYTIATHDEKRTIWESILQVDTISTLSSDGKKRLSRIKNTLQQAFFNQNEHSLSQWIEGVWIELGGPATLKTTYEIDQAQTFFKLIDQVDSDSSIFQISLFTDALNQLFAQPNTTTDSNIHIMTIHKSKGLEFDHVIIPGLNKQTPPDQEKLFRWLERSSALGSNDLILAPVKSTGDESDKIYSYLKEVERDKLNHEMTRLLYVAATRAKQTLDLLADIKRNDKKPTEAKTPSKSSFLGKLWTLMSDQANLVCATQFTTMKDTAEHTPEIVKTHDRLSANWSNMLNDQTVSDTESKKSRLISIPLETPSQAPRLTGTVIHAILQRIAEGRLTLNKDTASWPIAQWKADLLTAGVLPSELSQSMDIVTTAIKNTTTDERGQWILSSEHEQAAAEWALTFYDEQAIKHIIIDRTFISTDGTRWIIDYKISAPNPGESLENFLESQQLAYEQQLSYYGKALSLHDVHPIKLGLYFPLCQGWIEWTYSLSQS